VVPALRSFSEAGSFLRRQESMLAPHKMAFRPICADFKAMSNLMHNIQTYLPLTKPEKAREKVM
jgi:hypothetical protein